MPRKEKRSFINLYTRIVKNNIEEDLSLDESESNHIISALKKVYYYYYENHGYNEINNVDVEDLSEQDQIMKMAKSIRLRVKSVSIESKWWQFDSDAILVFDKKHHLPWILLPSSEGTYILYDIVNGLKTKVREEDADLFETHGYVFYPQFADEPLGWQGLIKFACKGSISDIRRVIGLQFSISLLGLLFPFITGILIDTIIPNADYGQLMQMTFFLAVAIIVGGIFFILQLICTLRFTIKMDYRTQAALWDRIIRLPLKFFSRYDTGDLINRVAGMTDIQQILTNSIISSGTSAFIVLASSILMLFYSLSLGLIALVFMAIFVAVVIFAIIIELKYQSKINFFYGKIEAFLLQMVGCIQKIKITDTGNIFFRKWLRSLQKKYQYIFLSGKLIIYLDTFYLIIGPLVTILFFTVVSTQLRELPLGYFIAFSAAFAQLYVALGNLIHTAINVANVVPLYQRVKPVLLALPELTHTLLSPKHLSGRIDVNQVSFRYHEDNSFVLHKCQLTIEPGQHVAIIAPSGSGKTTLLRLLLGLEQPELGQICYDGIDIRYINVQHLRQKVGVVLQTHRLMAGTIADNISGFRNLDPKILWEVAKLACIDNDISAMPMGMKSYVDENGSLFSTGQRQRILLARALSNKPQILFLDEATSALDNVTQAKIQKNLEAMNITRVSFAHRLSTIINADNIYVLDAGHVIQQGNYQTLLNDTEGLFYHLIKHQQL